MSDTNAPTPGTTAPYRKPMKELVLSLFHWGGILSFWGWNVIAGLVVTCLILPFLFLPLIGFALTGGMPLSIFFFILALMALPFVAMWVGGTRKVSIPALMFGIEIPLFTLLMMRMFLIRELTFASAFLIGSGIVAICLFAWGHLRGNDETLSVPTHALYRRLSPLVLIAGVFVGILSALYAIPMLANLIKAVFEFFTFKWIGGFYSIETFLFALLALAFFFATMFVFIVFPIYVAVYYPALWRGVGQASAKVMSKSNFLGYTLGFFFIWYGIQGLSSLQPHANFTTEVKQMSMSERAELVQTPAKVKKRLLHAYLNEYRYLSHMESSNNLDVTYRRTFGSNFWHIPQSIQNYLLAPLLYKGSWNDKVQAGRLYQDMFDVSIQRDYQDEIAKALKTTYNRDDIEAGLMNIGARNVALTEQNITVEDKGEHAVISIEEVYKNLTSENQEIFYYFSLPSDAALTGIWIGQTEKREDMDAYIVAPRGAAQQVYERSVRRQIDPALLEQVGPRQYRLRIFPIPVENAWMSQGASPFKPMRLHMEIAVPRSESGFSLPKLLEKRNIDWTRRTKRTLNGARMKRIKDWMPSHVEARMSESLRAFSIDTVAGYSVTAVPQQEPLQTEALNLAVLVDTSYSMRDVNELLEADAKSLSAWAKKNFHTIDYFLSFANGDAAVRRSTIDLKSLKLFGRISAEQQIEDFKRLADDVTYDAVIILTDQGTYGTDIPQDGLTLEVPLWFIHLGLPAYAYDDHVLDLIYRSGGGIAEGVQDFQRRIGFARESVVVGDSHVWRVNKNDNSSDVLSSLSSLGAKQIIAHAARGQSPTPEALDSLHAIAKTHAVVTPYSSMIVLVNERQKQALKEASEKEDRFDRESKLGEETLQSPHQPLVSAVPEPHEWLLIVLSCMMLAYAYKNRERWTRT